MNFGLLLETFLATTWKRLLWLFGVGILAVGLISCYQSATDRARAQAEIESRNHLIELQDRTIAAKDNQIKVRAEETARAKREIDALRRRPATVREIAVEIPRFISLPAGPTFKPFEDLAAPSLGDSGPKPDAGSIVFDAAQAQSLRTFYLGCAEQKIDLGACRGDLADMKAKAEAERLRADLFKDQRDAAVRGLKGGGRWQRFLRNSKMVGVGIVLGVAGGIALTR
jgi:hypothetical protein